MVTDLREITVGDLRLVPSGMYAYWRGKEVTLPRTPFMLTYDLASHAGIIRTRNQLLDFAWGTGVFVEDRSVDSMIKKVRRKFEAAGPFEEIQSIYCVGYRWRKPI